MDKLLKTDPKACQVALVASLLLCSRVMMAASDSSMTLKEISLQAAARERKTTLNVTSRPQSIINLRNILLGAQGDFSGGKTSTLSKAEQEELCDMGFFSYRISRLVIDHGLTVTAEDIMSIANILAAAAGDSSVDLKPEEGSLARSCQAELLTRRWLDEAIPRTLLLTKSAPGTPSNINPVAKIICDELHNPNSELYAYLRTVGAIFFLQVVKKA